MRRVLVTEEEAGPALFRQPPEPDKAPPAADREMSLVEAEVAEWVKAAIVGYERARPRSTQVMIGPSEIGHECDQRIARKLAGCPKPNRGDNWAAIVGTACHSMEEKAVSLADPGALVEWQVTMRTPAGREVRGTLDLYREGRVYDWKHPGASSLRKARQQGASEQYQVQGQLYGYGAAQAGVPVNDIAVVFLPRAEATLDKTYVHVMPYDEARALRALARLDMIAYAVEAGVPVASVKRAPGFMCRYCPFYRPGVPSDFDGCPGK